MCGGHRVRGLRAILAMSDQRGWGSLFNLHRPMMGKPLFVHVHFSASAWIEKVGDRPSIPRWPVFTDFFVPLAWDFSISSILPIPKSVACGQIFSFPMSNDQTFCICTLASWLSLAGHRRLDGDNALCANLQASCSIADRFYWVCPRARPFPSLSFCVSRCANRLHSAITIRPLSRCQW